MTSQHWFEDLNHRLDTWLDAWLVNHPDQGAMLEEDERNQARSAGTRHWAQLQQEAQQLRQVLLQQGEVIRLWRQRQQEALAGHNRGLARQCAHHEQRCRQAGQVMWERLEMIGALRPEERRSTTPRLGWRMTEAPLSLQQAWSNFMVEQQLNQLKRQAGQG